MTHRELSSTESHRDSRLGLAVLEKARGNRGDVSSIYIGGNDLVFDRFISNRAVFPAVEFGIVEGQLDGVLPRIDTPVVRHNADAINIDLRQLDRAGVYKVVNTGNRDYFAAHENRDLDTLHDLIILGVRGHENGLHGFGAIPVYARIGILPRKALGELDIRQPLPIGGLETGWGLVARLRLGDSKRDLARPGVEAGALNDGDSLARRDVVAVRDGEGVCRDYFGGDGGLVGLAGVGQPLRVDREHRRLDRPGHADLDLDAIGPRMVAVGRSVITLEGVLPGVSDGERRILPRESLGELHVGKILTVDGFEPGRGLEGWLCLGDGERHLARPGVEAGALNDGGRFARRGVVSVRDGEGSLRNNRG